MSTKTPTKQSFWEKRNHKNNRPGVSEREYNCPLENWNCIWGLPVLSVKPSQPICCSLRNGLLWINVPAFCGRLPQEGSQHPRFLPLDLRKQSLRTPRWPWPQEHKSWLQGTSEQLWEQNPAELPAEHPRHLQGHPNALQTHLKSVWQVFPSAFLVLLYWESLRLFYDSGPHKRAGDEVWSIHNTIS